MSASVQVNIEQGTPEWHQWRQKGVGASDVAALFDDSPYKTERDLWFEKVGLGEADDDQNEYIFKLGHKVEDLIRELAQEKFKSSFLPTCFERGKVLASLDGYDPSGVVLEAKLVGAKVLKAASDGVIPVHHDWQIQTQLFSSEADKAVWVGHDGKKKGQAVEIGRDEAKIKLIENKVDEFWESVDKMVMPPLGPNDIKFITDDPSMKLFRRLTYLKTNRDMLDEEYKAIEAEIKKLADHPKVRCGSVTVTTYERQGSIDYTKIPEVKSLEKEYIEGFRKAASPVKRISFKKEESK